MSKPQDYILIKLSSAHTVSIGGYTRYKVCEQSNNLGYDNVNGDTPLGEFLKNTHTPAVMIPKKFLSNSKCRFINKPACVDDFYNDSPIAKTPTVEFFGLSSKHKWDYYICIAVDSLTVRNFDGSVSCSSIPELTKSNAYQLVIKGSFHGKNLPE